MPIIGGYHHVDEGGHPTSLFPKSNSPLDPTDPTSLLGDYLHSDVIATSQSHHPNINFEKRKGGSKGSGVASNIVLCSSKPTAEEQKKCWETVGEATGGSLVGVALIAFILYRCCRAPRPRTRQRQQMNSANALRTVQRNPYNISADAMRAIAPIPRAHLSV